MKREYGCTIFFVQAHIAYQVRLQCGHMCRTCSMLDAGFCDNLPIKKTLEPDDL
jgi:hypothetical protein